MLRVDKRCIEGARLHVALTVDLQEQKKPRVTFRQSTTVFFPSMATCWSSIVLRCTASLCLDRAVVENDSGRVRRGGSLGTLRGQPEDEGARLPTKIAVGCRTDNMAVAVTGLRANTTTTARIQIPANERNCPAESAAPRTDWRRAPSSHWLALRVIFRVKG